MTKDYPGPERREFVRLDYVTPIAYKICKKETLDRLFNGYTANVSPTGIMCTIKDKVDIDDVLWLSFDRGILHICEELEKRSLIYQNGIIGKVVRVDYHRDHYSVGIRFLTREEENSSHIFPRVHFIKEKDEKV
ncbi:MAG: PilZ domain-containing protein [Candidatus Omnitrophota bacterium]